MTKGTIAVGLDIGSTKIAAVAVEAHDRNTIEVIGFSEISVPTDAIVKGAVKNVMQVGKAIREALSELTMRSNIDIEEVNMSFGGTHIQVASISPNMVRPTSANSSEVTQADVDHLIKDQYRAQTEPNHEVMHIIPGEFTIDNGKSVKEPVGRIGVRLGGEFLVVSSNKQAIDVTKKSLITAGPGVDYNQLLLAPIAAGMAVLSDEEMAAGTALVDIGDHVTDLVIYHGGMIRHIASFPIAGQHITADLQIGCGIQKENAENLKKRQGESLSENVPLNMEILVNFLQGHPARRVLRKNMALIIEERLKEIAAMVYAEILDSGFADLLVGGMVLTGGTAHLSEIEMLFHRVSNGMLVRVGNPVGLANTPMADEVGNTSYATALGLAWAGLKRVDPRVESICPSPMTQFEQARQREETRQRHTEPGSTSANGGGMFPGWGGLKRIFGGSEKGEKDDKAGGSY